MAACHIQLWGPQYISQREYLTHASIEPQPNSISSHLNHNTSLRPGVASMSIIDIEAYSCVGVTLQCGYILILSLKILVR